MDRIFEDAETVFKLKKIWSVIYLVWEEGDIIVYGRSEWDVLKLSVIWGIQIPSRGKNVVLS